MNNSQVLIVGAGPVGLNMALVLHHYGINFQIIDKKDGPNKTSNAVGVNARTLELWHKLGISELAIKAGIKLKGISWYSGTHLLSQASFANIESPYDYVVSLPQSQTEHILAKRLGELGINIRWNTELLDFNQDNKIVSATLKTPKGEEKHTSNWIIGCDGYRSRVRELAKIERGARDLSQHFLMIDAKIDGDIPHDQLSLFFHNDGVLFFIPMQDRMRVVAEISNDHLYKDLKSGDGEVFNLIFQKRRPGLSVARLDWSSAFYVHECLVKEYVKGCVILAGDAAHTHSPAGGQGMNTGIQDTWNLGWKLAHVLKGEARVGLLDTYHIERHQIAQDVLNRSGKMTTIASTENKIIQTIRNFGISHLINIEFVASKLVNSLAQTDICYQNSTLVMTKDVLKYGKTRYQLDGDDGWVLLSRTYTDLALDLPKFVKLKQNSYDLLAKDAPRFCLVRPDGYVAVYADDIIDIHDYFRYNLFV